VSVQRTTNQQKWTAIALRMPSASRYSVVCMTLKLLQLVIKMTG